MFRSSTTLFVAAIDFILLGTHLSYRQILACAMITAGGIMYAMNDLESSLLGWLWGSLYAIFMVLNSVYIKHVFNHQFEMSAWEKTFLNNFTALPLILAWAIQEDIVTATIRLSELPAVDLLVVVLSCLGGFGMNWLEYLKKIPLASCDCFYLM